MNPAARPMLLGLLALAACGPDEQAPPAEAAPRQTVATPAARQPAIPGHRFVQDFYDAYTRVMMSPGAWETLKRDRAAWFDPALLRALDEDRAASAASPDEIVGLDFDPFVASQDPCERYEVGSESPAGAGHRVEVFTVCGGTPERTPSVVAEIEERDGAWVFVNFHYPNERSDLLRVLAELKRARSAAR